MRYYDLTKEDHAEILAAQISAVLKETDMSLLDLIKHPSFTILHPRSYYYSGISWAIPADNDNFKFASIVGLGANPCAGEASTDSSHPANSPRRSFLSCLAAVRDFFWGCIGKII